jgi:5'-nucleotidase
MRILVTNDDGIESEGIQVLARFISEAGHDVVVVAPDGEASGSGAALGNLQPDNDLRVRKVAIDGLASGEAWALEGTPALCVVAARLGAFGPPPELVVSGINAGLNTGRSLLHSGTVGAALTAQNFGLSGLAVSIDATDEWHWDTAAAIAVEVLDQVIAAPARSVVNLNVPGRPRAEVLGTRWARLAPLGAVRASVSARTDDHVQFELIPTGFVPAEDTDQGSVEAGWAALTTLVGLVEAWPDDEPIDVDRPATTDESNVTYLPRIVPGATLHPVHQVPDASDHRLLRRPGLA